MASPVLGIDLGTTNTVVSVCGRDGVSVLHDSDGETLIPSIVSFMPSGDVVVGRLARERRLIDAANTVFSVKRLIGRPFRTPEVRRAAERTPFGLVESANGGVEVRIRTERHSLPEISAFVLRRARAVAEEALARSCSHAVLTVPANFNELQRTATRDAGRIAGLHVLRILNEPTAAALAYGFGARTNRRIAVYDLGGGTFDMSILDLSGDVIEVIATAGDSYLGGDDIDTLIADRMAAAFLAEQRVDLRSDPQGYERLRVAAEWLKVQLSATDRAHCRVEQAAFGPHGAHLDLQHTLTRAELEELIEPLVKRTFDICESAMRVAAIRPSQVDEVILVGSQTLAPKVRSMVADYFGRDPLTTVNPSHVVAEGAAVLGYALTGGSPTISPAIRAPQISTQSAPVYSTLVPPSPSMPAPAPKPSTAKPIGTSTLPYSTPAVNAAGEPLKGNRPTSASASAIASSLPTATEPEPEIARPRRTLPPAVVTSSAPPPIYPGFDEDEPTTIAPRSSESDSFEAMEEPLPGEPDPLRRSTDRKGQSPDRTAPLFSSFGALEDEPTQISPPRAMPTPQPPPEAPTRVSSAPTASTAARTAPTPSPASAPVSAPPPRVSAPPVTAAPVLVRGESGRLSPAPRAPAATPLGAVALRTKPSSPPPPPSPPPAPPPPIAVPPASFSTPPRPPTPRPSAAPDTSSLRSTSNKPWSPPPTSPPPTSPPPITRSSAPPAARSGPPAPISVAPPSLISVAPPAPSVPPPASPELPARESRPSDAPRSSPAPSAPLLLDVTPHSLAVETAGGYCEPIIERNAPIPTEQTRRFSTSQDNQVSVRMRICQGEERRVDDNQLLGTIELTELRAASRGVVKIEVTFVIDASGTLSVRARDDETGRSQRVRVDLVGGLREEDVTRMWKKQKGIKVRG